MIKMLIVASYNSNRFSPFVIEQKQALADVGINVELYGVLGKGIRGYYSNRGRLLNKIADYNPDLIHAHYGLSGLLANLQRKIPVITTFHGSDIHSSKKILFFSRIAMYLSKHNIFVSRSIYEISKYKFNNFSIQPCGINIRTFYSIDKEEARELIGWNSNDKYILFAGSFENFIKNSPLAQRAVSLLDNCQLIELKGYSRERVNLLMNACDCLLMTSYREASPMVIKEAMICGCPIVSVDVGDVKWIIGNTEGCYLTSYEVEDCTSQIKKAIQFSITKKKTNGRNRIIDIGLDNRVVATKLIAIYNSVLTGI
jgi:glycosyltransferase involved in cell wall biosynthesis